ncbi:MAG: alpha/beta fold hydrolase [Deltaproteobacteria bacterium]|nr:MAG: alpha/beta fold hydrolase [Deltaproteobacteria bacterium]
MNMIARSMVWCVGLFCFGLFFQVGCGAPEPQTSMKCNDEPIVMKTAAGIEFVRTPDDCFKNLPDFPYEPKYVEIDGLRQAYVEDGPADGQVVLLLHGQPSWSYLYRKMIPVLAKAGYRAIAMDHIGMGRSDKPIQVKDYTYLGHIDRLEKFIQKLGLKDITLFCQDWGSLIGLHVAGKHPDWFARIVVGNGALPVIPAGTQPFPPVENPDEVNNDLKSSFNSIPAQQVPFYDDNCKLRIPGGSGTNSGSGLGGGAGDFGAWIRYAMTASVFKASEVLEALTWFDLPDNVEAAYDAPFPSRTYMTGPRTFPSLVNQTPGQNDASWKGLMSFKKPFLTIWAANDPGNLGQCATQDNLICNIPGAKGQPHTRLPKASHFLQDDQGADIARLMVDFMSKNPTSKGDYNATCDGGQNNPTLPVTSDGTGTPCKSDDDCSSLKAAKKCLKMGSSQGFCTVEGCKPDSCGESYSCCRECNPALASMLPFKDSACFPAAATSGLTGQAGCTCDKKQGSTPGQQRPMKFRGERFCEVLLGFPKDGGKIELKIYNTFGLNDCPKAEWEGLDADKIKTENNAAAVVLNGPRFWTMDAIKATGSSPSTETKTFGALKMRLGGTIVLDAKDMSSMNSAKPYVEGTVNRETEFTFNAGEMVFQLISPKQEVYTMQTFNHSVESDLTLSNLAQLDTRLTLPDGWSFKATKLTEKLVLTAKGQATVLRDNFQNTYQKNNP